MRVNIYEITHMSRASVFYARGDVFDTPGVLVHQVYCVPLGGAAAGLAAAVRARLGATDYRRSFEAPLGTICVEVPPVAGATTHVVHLRGQRRPGPPAGDDDAPAVRLAAFRDALGRLRLWLAAQPPAAVVFPERIGCGLAGGRWDEYRACVEEFAAALDPALHPVVVVARKHPLP